MRNNLLGTVTHQIARIQAIDGSIDPTIRIIASERLTDLALAVARFLRAHLLEKVFLLQHVESLLVELLKQLPFPFRPDIRSDCAQVGECQQEQHTQVFTHPHQLGKLRDHLHIVQISTLGDVRHLQMVLDQELQTLAVFAIQSQSPGDGRNHRRTATAVVIATAFADIVKQNRQQQQLTLLDIVGNLSQQRVAFGIIAIPELAHLFNRKQ